MTDDQQAALNNADEENADASSILGHAPEESADVDETLKAVGLAGDDEDGPRELNSDAIISAADQHQD